jgi:hypothetical protein
MLGSRAARKSRHRKSARLKRAITTTQAIQGKGLQQQEALSRLGTQQQLAGYDTARKEASRLGRTAKQTALDRGTQLEASASQNLANRGLGSTTAGANLSRGISSDTSRTLGGIDEGLAGIFGDLALGRSGVEAQGTQNLAGIAGQRTGMESSLAQMGLLGGQQLGQFDIGPWEQPSTAQNLLHGISTGAGAFMGGQGGGQNQMLMQMLQELFSQNQGSQSAAFRGSAAGQAPIPQSFGGYY